MMTVTIPEIETARARLRGPRLDDFAVFDRYFATERSKWNGGPLDERKARFRIFGYFFSHWLLRGYGMFVIADRTTDRALGCCGLWHPIHWPEPEIGWSLWDETIEGQGVAFEAAQAAIADTFTRVGLPTTVSYIDPANARSIALAERLGATRDETANRPDPDDLVYRHAHPETRQ